MRWDKLEGQLAEAPQLGYVLAYTREHIFFQKYSLVEEVKELLQESDILELHLFDKDKEYRAISTTSKRFPEGVISTVVTDGERDTEIDIYMEENILEKSEYQKVKGKLRVLNYVTYNENGMATIDNYRLTISEEVQNE